MDIGDTSASMLVHFVWLVIFVLEKFLEGIFIDIMQIAYKSATK